MPHRQDLIEDAEKGFQITMSRKGDQRHPGLGLGDAKCPQGAAGNHDTAQTKEFHDHDVPRFQRHPPLTNVKQPK